MHSAANLWVFGYGSLIWRPGFDYLASHSALLPGAHRQLCVYSYHYRGTREAPGLVFGLMRGGSCRGMAFEVAAAKRKQVHAYLRDRELISDVYDEVMRPVRVGNQIVNALTYLVNQGHEQFAGGLSLDEQEILVRRAIGDAGANRDYVVNTADHLESMGIRDRRLGELARRLRSS